MLEVAGIEPALASAADPSCGWATTTTAAVVASTATAAIAAIYQESGARWAVFVTAWTTAMGYGVATVYYQAATWAQHPGASLAWIAGVTVSMGLVLWALRRHGAREAGASMPLPQQV